MLSFWLEPRAYAKVSDSSSTLIPPRFMTQTFRLCLFAAICLAPIIGNEDPAIAQSQAPSVRTLTLTLCNKTNKLVDTILIHRSIEGEDFWMLRGWWSLSPSKCVDLPGIPKGYFYYYSEERGGNGWAWNGNARTVCIQTPPVERAIFPKEKCLFGEKKVGFREVYSIQDQYQILLK
ncbi:DUF1036 domain-containing protein [Bradyrhizobium sp. HKCCYLS20291]|uniref:DUF1036 domain-containing protein n=1 Tax=Bradyrhizobium sp. HKCCYLS20291 TaxID=3420766 RepID=UPI003EBABA36